jgi:phospholipase/carboxylesterase
MYKGSFLNGPELSALSGHTKQLIIFMHGLGSDGTDLIELAPIMQGVLPDAHFISPNATEPYDMAPFGYQWFSVQDRSPEILYAELERVRPRVTDFILSKLEHFNLLPQNLALVGFSQGTMTALHMALRLKEQIGCIIGFSGALIAPHMLGQDLKSKPPICLIHGVDDEVVDVSMMYHAEEALKEQAVHVETLTVPNLNHSIDSTGLTKAINFLKNHLKS